MFICPRCWVLQLSNFMQTVGRLHIFKEISAKINHLDFYLAIYMSKNSNPLAELIAEQKLLCDEFGSSYVEVSGDDVIAVAVHSLKQDPIVGLRNKAEGDENVSWFIYGGELAEGEDSFETMTVRDLQDLVPQVLPYLALDVGFRFMIDGDDYEDVWKEGDAS